MDKRQQAHVTSEQPDDQVPTPERRAELEAAFEANNAAGSPPYAGVHLRTKGEITWILAERGWSGTEDDYTVKYTLLPQGVKIERADFRQAVFADANLGDIRLRRANLSGANLVRAKLRGAQLTDADLSSADLGFADLTDANLSWVNLSAAHLREVSLYNAQLPGADLSGAGFTLADLSRANLRAARLSATTSLWEVTIDDGTQLGDVIWNGATLTHIEWSAVQRLGDEMEAKRTTRGSRTTKRKHQELADYAGAVRAYKQLAVALQTQGLADEAARFGYRAQVLQRGLRWRQKQYGRWFFSVLLATLSGYGYRLWRIFAAYILIVGLFAAAFLIPSVFSSSSAPTVQQAADALQISLNAIHGRVFFAQFHLDTLQSWLATAESIIGIVIEGVFVAMLVQRFFGGR